MSSSAPTNEEPTATAQATAAAADPAETQRLCNGLIDMFMAGGADAYIEFGKILGLPAENLETLRGAPLSPTLQMPVVDRDPGERSVDTARMREMVHSLDEILAEKKKKAADGGAAAAGGSSANVDE